MAEARRALLGPLIGGGLRTECAERDEQPGRQGALLGDRDLAEVVEDDAVFAGMSRAAAIGKVILRALRDGAASMSAWEIKELKRSRRGIVRRSLIP
ncbi:hypothetical protein [Antarcticirhabdus aurantiaca]|uniref:Uncharacterized protein n=1 Tax=Antarcticirhabdus aurantiaca TaxID=2606717 RepID=A0ACD4NI04_9HYPH|nr:hypothetical protein [Antarcticirhabdus aurantiaca]WAJ26473.1 hypothetical protein OXU80_16485 [Jeongeuplla avenae]